ncbi:MAG: hemolysin III family protein, partial [Myxococcota bacterium]
MSEAVTREFEHVFTREEEQINAATHGLGIVLSLVGLGMLIQQALTSANPIELACYTVFGLSMVAMFTASTLFHLFEDEALKLRFEMFDHMAIYLLIAGTYTPITLLGMGGTTGWVLFVAIWALVGIGLLSELFWKGRPRWVSTAIFLFLGWMF